MHSSPEALGRRPLPWLKTAGLIGLGLVVLIVISGLVTRGLAHQKVKSWTLAEAVPTVSLIHPAASGAADNLVLPGDVQANYDAAIHARVSGYLKAWYVDIGAKVKAGQVLADIDTPELDQQLAQARANLNTAMANQSLAQITAKRWAALLAKDAVSQQEADEKAGDLAAKSALVQAAKAEVDRLAALASFKRIVAPFAGVVTARNTDIGALIAAGQPNDPGLFSVADTSRLRIYVHAPQTYAAAIKPGQTATLTAPEYPGQTFKATLSSTSEAINAQSGTLLVELQMDNEDGLLKPGYYVQARFDLPAPAGGVQLPASALMFRHKGMAVATLGPNNRVQIKYVTIAKDMGATVQIADGLSATDQVIDNPPDSIETGDAVRPADAAAAKG
jgi:RND family efflux transporter MFP subunit